ncbi:hypothetical protein HBA54_09185 [Pelagibius litoralis]|uniref:Uncharacterized protein n=1 Tax=Pelagibius litoralis TaxID=374515 RepID=A0A967EWW8_9PROT|nr:hypothetical protein [Pelagibius litoralis]NIA68763.1 hypothetical protein [Pelagibius litoralis]
MWKPGKTKAEEQFAATQKKAKQVVREKEKLEQERSDRMAKLRALRLAKEAADEQAAEVEKTATETKKT